MTSAPTETKTDTMACNCCGQAVETAAECLAADAAILCDRCYLSSLAPDHRDQEMETFD
jgi:hypothetical protein